MDLDPQQPLVSVAMPTYNRPEGLRRALQCVTGQTYKNLQILVSDDCSPEEETQKVMHEFSKKDPRIECYRQKKNLGAGLNHGFVLEKATGDYYMWACDDDEWEPTFVEECVRAFDDDTVLAFPHARIHNRKRGTAREVLLPKLSKEKSKFQNLVALYENFAPNIIHGLHRTDNWRRVINSSEKFDLIGFYWLTKILLCGDIVIVDNQLYTIGIDEYEYVKKPVKPLKNKTFVYFTPLANVLKLVNGSTCFCFSEKLRAYRVILTAFCTTYLCNEKEHSCKTLGNRLKYWLVGTAVSSLQAISYCRIKGCGALSLLSRTARRLILASPKGV